MYFPRYLIGSILTACFAVVIKYLEKCLTMCLILSCAKEAIYKRKNSIFIFYINTFQRKQFTKIGIDSGFMRVIGRRVNKTHHRYVKAIRIIQMDLQTNLSIAKNLQLALLNPQLLRYTSSPVCQIQALDSLSTLVGLVELNNVEYKRLKSVKEPIEQTPKCLINLVTSSTAGYALTFH